MTDELNDGHLHEIADRMHVAICMIQEHILTHPATTACRDLEIEVQNAMNSLATAYMYVGQFETAADLLAFSNPK